MLPCLNFALSDVMANISQLEWQTGIKEIAIVHMANPPPAGPTDHPPPHSDPPFLGCAAERATIGKV